jgi:hypothetical protein
MKKKRRNSCLEPIDLDSEFLNILEFVIKMLSKEAEHWARDDT